MDGAPKPKRPLSDKQLEQLRKAREKARLANDKPARVGPPSGIPASGMPAMGAGLHGPAKGQATFHPGVYVPPRPLDVRLAEADEMLDGMVALARDPAIRPETRLNAMQAVRNHVLGTPVARQITAEVGAEDLLTALMDVSRQSEAG